MANRPYAEVTAKSPPRYRRGGLTTFSPKKFKCQAFTGTWAWGSEPASATLVYPGSAPISSGSALTIKATGHTFYGVCKRDSARQGSGGFERTLEFVDNRDYLDWDLVYGCFNKLEEVILNGNRVRRYYHILPANFNSGLKTYAPNGRPLTAAEILDYIVGVNKWVTTEDPWVCAYHQDQIAYPVFDVDCMGGKKLKAVLQEISDAQGLVFTLMGGPYSLVWARKGEGSDIPFPGGSDNRTAGTYISGNATRIRILGDRNIYQVLGIPMSPDWKTAWEQFYDISLFTEQIYRIGKTRTEVSLGGSVIPAGTKFSDISTSDDPERIVAYQLALAESLEITVGEFAALAGDASFKDFRKFAGRSRMEMPAALYIRQILFRAFRFPSNFAIKGAYGQLLGISSLSIASKMPAAITHDPITGTMSPVIDGGVYQSADGVGYAIVKGYQVGKDMFATLRPDRFDFSKWNSAQDVWQHIEFQVDDSGEEDGKYILFDEPVIRSENIITMVDGYAVFNANPVFTVPEVRLAITFEGEPFSYVAGVGTRDDVENVRGLNGEFISTYGLLPLEIPYLDGKTATQKAAEIAGPILARQTFYTNGSYVRYPKPLPNGQFPPGTQLTGRIDRVTVSLGPQGCTETVDLTAERPRDTYIPERDLERVSKFKALLPGQAQLRQEANTARLIASAAKSSPQAKRTVAEAFNGIIGAGEPLAKIRIEQ